MRLFLAVRPADHVVERLRELQRMLGATHPGWRWVPPSQIHLTLRFLGEVDEATELAAQSHWQRAARSVPRFRLALGGVGRFPPRGRARVLWIGVGDPDGGTALAELAERIEQATRLSGFAAERRPFHSHLTLARAGKQAPGAVPIAADAVHAPPFLVDRVVLFQSELGPTGARYTERSSFALAPPLAGSSDADAAV
ncbi:MAG TPA: RNA 2',3'-cyclic phosphodiesterase [Candidatus Polarisedimenticolaceae bacterium]|nr:RNA 2',3'-cyclic phosphodiesterase [Candidatus Polarisedimenticolaceae bacterium]